VTANSGRWSAMIDPNIADVWTVELTATADFDPRGWSVLAADERERANRLIREDDRARWVQARSTLRRVLARYLSAEPGAIVFGKRKGGKPEVIEPRGSDLRFNASRSGSVAVIAIAVAHEVGVDVERIQDDFAWEAVARAFFSSAELAAIKRRRRGEQCRAFFECWVGKEAYLKGLGVGLTPSSKDFSAPFEGRRAQVTDPARPEPPSERVWHLEALDIAEGYAAAVATEGGCTIVSRRS
jgi:4'-phosphopantetheinyl transferase